MQNILNILIEYNFIFRNISLISQEKTFRRNIAGFFCWEKGGRPKGYFLKKKRFLGLHISTLNSQTMFQARFIYFSVVSIFLANISGT